MAETFHVMNSIVQLLPGREKSLKRHHQWVFSGAIAKVKGNPAPGDTVLVTDSRGEGLALAAWSPQSQLSCRVWSFNPQDVIDREFFAQVIRKAVDLRRRLGLLTPVSGCRLVAAEGDNLPGLTADWYAGFIVIQSASCGVEHHKALLAELLMAETGAKGVFDRSDLSIRSREGLEQTTGILLGEAPPELIEIEENGLRLLVDVRKGHKTGFYLDQRENRKAAADLIKPGDEVLNCFAYTGAFAAAVLKAGAKSVVNVDSSAPALAMAEKNCKLNRAEGCINVVGDVFTELRNMTDAGKKFDMVILDPPKFIDSKNSLTRGCRAYQDIARLGFGLLKEGGVLLTFSCS
ncbi:MAG: class I SAM-dependent methyltransferase, partial [Lentisphaeria bacterium]|nr:class I SAM-dependent methyltransferase [Lentisphaeria bacterium]